MQDCQDEVAPNHGECSESRAKLYTTGRKNCHLNIYFMSEFLIEVALLAGAWMCTATKIYLEEVVGVRCGKNSEGELKYYPGKDKEKSEKYRKFFAGFKPAQRTLMETWALRGALVLLGVVMSFDGIDILDLARSFASTTLDAALASLSDTDYEAAASVEVRSDEARNITYLDDPSTHKTLLQDLFDEEQYYELLSYGTWIKNNTFANNYSGKRGTALLLELVNNLLIEDNEFKNNGPV